MTGASVVYDGRFIATVGDTLPGITDGSVFIGCASQSAAMCSDVGDGQADALTPAVPRPCSNESDISASEGCENSQGHGA